MPTSRYALDDDQTRAMCGEVLEFDPQVPDDEGDVLAEHYQTCPDCLAILRYEGDQA